MSQTPTPEIRGFFDGKLNESLLGIGYPDIPVAWFNHAFNPSNVSMYLRPTHLLNPTQPRSLGTNGFEQINGIYVVDVFVLKDTGIGPCELLARAIADVFRGGQRFDTGCYTLIINTSYLSSPQIDDSRCFIPVTIEWLAYTQK